MKTASIASIYLTRTTLSGSMRFCVLEHPTDHRCVRLAVIQEMPGDESDVIVYECECFLYSLVEASPDWLREYGRMLQGQDDQGVIRAGLLFSAASHITEVSRDVL